MKKILAAVFITACFALCLLPSLGMIFAPSTEPIGNERETQLPKLTDSDGKLNTSYPAQLGDYFGTHFAFRPLAITADAKIQASLFMTSNNESVVTGTDGWLFYSSTLDNYLGENVFSDRKAKALVHNLELIQDFSKSHSAQFLFTVAPNKNSLYPEHMPYYYGQKVSDKSNREMVGNALKDSGVNYCNLYPLFEDNSEELYLARDSHWNNKGALTAYNAILTQLGKAHDDYSTAQSTRKKDFSGDLGKMIFPSGFEPEFNTYYGAEDRYSYVTETKSVEEASIKTESTDGTGSLYMYRDSFGNSLLPYFASAYKTAAFTKNFPMLLEQDFNEAKPDTFVMELVERNLDWLVTRPPIFTAPEVTLFKTDGKLGGSVKTEIAECEFSPLYTEISGEVDCESLHDDAVLYVSLTDGNGKTAVYEALTICTYENENGFKLYLPSEIFPAGTNADVKIIAKNGDGFYEIGG